MLTVDGQPAYIEFSDGNAVASTQTLTDIDLSSLNEVHLVVTSYVPDVLQVINGPNTTSTNTIDDITFVFDGALDNLKEGGDSTTWTNYKSSGSNDTGDASPYNHDTDIYDLNIGQRYGLDPEHAQTNGSYFIDNLRGLIHFSSNCSGRTIVLDYISDSLGTDEEIKVHKFAEEAMYKWISHAILASRMNTPEYLVNRYKKERFAAIRQAKLRLSNIKLEEITQIMRGKSKWIKH